MPDFSVDTQDLINGAVLGALFIGGFLVGGLLGLGFAFGIGMAYIELTTELNRLSKAVDGLEAENRALKKRISELESE
jgi:cell division protein FtsB